MTDLNPRLVEINQKNSAFWANQNKRLSEQMADSDISNDANRLLNSEDARGVSIYSKLTFENAHEIAEQQIKKTLSRFGNKGRTARGPDRLTELIESIVSRKPDISIDEMKGRLQSSVGGGVITRISSGVPEDAEIYYLDHKRREISASLSGLKDRLSRAKKSFRSRATG